MSFALVGIMVSIRSEYFTYSYLAEPFEIVGETFALNQIVAFCFAVLIGAILWLWLYFTRPGMAMRGLGKHQRLSTSMCQGCRRLPSPWAGR